jgi:hypothetical protein
VGKTNPADLRAMKELRSKLLGSKASLNLGPPWKAGYALASIARANLGLDSEPLPSLDEIGSALRTTRSELAQAIQQTPDSTLRFDGLFSVNKKESPGFVLKFDADSVRGRFHLCRGLFEYFTSSTLEPALLSRANSDRQAKNRAFAAEFLAPAEGLRKRVSSHTVTSDEVDELASEFGVSSLVVVHQLENHDISRVAM